MYFTVSVASEIGDIQLVGGLTRVFLVYEI